MTALSVVVGAALISALLYAALQKLSPAFALVLSLAAAAVMLLRLSAVLQSLLRGIAQLGRKTDGEAFACLLRCAGVLLLTDYARSLCEEADAPSLAWCTSFAGRCLVLAAAWPLLREVCEQIWELTG